MTEKEPAAHRTGAAVAGSAIDAALVARIEGLAARDVHEWPSVAERVHPGSGVRSVRIGTGVAMDGGTTVPFSQVVSVGLDGCLPAGQLDEVDRFYAGRTGLRVEFALVAGGRPDAAAALAARGWMLDEFEDVFVLPLEDRPTRAEAAGAGHDVRVANGAERDLWADVVATGFAEHGAPTETERRFARLIAARPDAILMIAFVGGEPAAAAELVLRDGIGWLSADTTLPGFRRRGLQQALQRARIEHAAKAGCEMAVTEAVPGGSSHRNIERVGFTRAYTRMVLTRSY